MPQVFNIDNDAFVWLTNKLEKMHKSALPNAVRGTLNGLALDLKKTEMPIQAEKSFVNREKNFFKANSTVDFAKGFDIDMMSASTGFLSQTSKKNKMAVADLLAQEHGGEIGGRKYIPVDNSRTSKSNNKRVRTDSRLTKIGIKNIVRTSELKGKKKGLNEGQRFVFAVHEAGAGGFVQSNLKNGVKMLWRVNSLGKTRDNKFKLTALYIVNDSKTVKINTATHFMEKATIKTTKKTPEIYKKEAERQFDRYFRR